MGKLFLLSIFVERIIDILVNRDATFRGSEPDDVCKEAYLDPCSRRVRDGVVIVANDDIVFQWVGSDVNMLHISVAQDICDCRSRFR